MMNKLLLKIVSPDGEIFSGEAKSILVTTTEGEVQIFAGHADLFAPLATGRAKLTLEDGSSRTAAVSGGFIIVSSEETKVVTTTFEFSDEIDLNRANLAKQKAEEAIKNAKEAKEIEIAKAKLLRAISRINVASGNI
ncbi:MAG: ATP synthase F1 subunit epsilon [Ruminococcaceae bacterium]|nr:ATP synthase F1 subunit epsilon [Oscillospiraceae bacterium]